MTQTSSVEKRDFTSFQLALTEFDCIVWKFRKFTLTLSWQKFRESNGFTKEADFTNFFLWERISRFSRSCTATLWKFRNFTATVFLQKFRQINVLLKNFTVSWFDGKNMRGSEFLAFPHTQYSVLQMPHFFRKNSVKLILL